MSLVHTNKIIWSVLANSKNVLEISKTEWLIFGGAGGKSYTPNPYTFVYLPYKNDDKDYSTNNRSTTSTINKYGNNRAVVQNSQYTILDGFSELYFTMHSRISLFNNSNYQIWFRYSDWSWNDIARCYLSWYGAVRININNNSYDTWYRVNIWEEHLYSIVVWRHKISFFVDWVKQFENNITWVSPVSNSKFCLFNRFYSPNEWIDGTVGEVIVENREWTDTEVSSYHYNSKRAVDAAESWGLYPFRRGTDTLYYEKFKGVAWSWQYVDTWIAFNSGSFTISMWAKSDRIYRFSDSTWATLVWKYYWWYYWSKEAFIMWVSCRDLDSQKSWLWIRDLTWVEASDIVEGAVCGIWEWHHIVATYDSVSKMLYLATDWVVNHIEKRDFWQYGNHSFYIWWINNYNWPANYFYWRIEEVIFEKKHWTPNNISYYYNKSKSDFWL